jgi:hypothetical protein
MAYQLNKTDGTLLTEIIDGQIDTSSTNLTFIGKNYKGWGESFNENFIKLLETFSNSTPPSKPIKGMLWYDSSTGRLKVYDGTTFRSTDSSILQATQPTLVDGDIWLNDKDNQMYAKFTEDDPILIGPLYTASQLKSGPEVVTVRDTNGTNRTIVKEFVNGSCVAIYSKAEFTLSTTINGFSDIKVGVNVSTLFDYEYQGVAKFARQFIDSSGSPIPLERFMRDDQNEVMTGTLQISNTSGLTIGTSQELNIFVDNTQNIIRSNIEDNDIRIQVYTNPGSTNPTDDPLQSTFFLDAIYIDTRNTSLLRGQGESEAAGPAIGFFCAPQYPFDFNGSVRIQGDLIIDDGEAVSLDVTNLRVEDKLIELAISDDSTLPTDAAVDGAGIAVRVEGDDKTWTWEQDTDSWTASHHIDIPALKSFKIGGVSVLNKTTLSSSVLYAPGLTQVGTLSSLQVDSLTFDGNRMTSNTSGLQIDSGGDIQLVTSRRITNVADPSSNTDVATKQYVDGAVQGGNVIFGITIDGLGTGATLQNNVATLLEELSPAADKTNGTLAKIYCLATSTTVDDIDINSNISKTTVAVDSAGTQNQSVVEDFSISDVTGQTVTTTYTRTIMEYEVSGGAWSYNSTTASAV